MGMFTQYLTLFSISFVKKNNNSPSLTLISHSPLQFFVRADSPFIQPLLTSKEKNMMFLLVVIVF